MVNDVTVLIVSKENGLFVDLLEIVVDCFITTTTTKV